MSRQPLQETGHLLADKWAGMLRDTRRALIKFQETRLYVQVVLAAGLVGFAALTALLPYGPLLRGRQALEWIIRHDYDFRAQADAARQWVQSKGGAIPAARYAWTSAQTRVQSWADVHGWIRTQPSQGERSGAALAGGVEPKTAETAGGQQPSPLMPVEGAVLFGYGWLPPGVGDRLHEGIDLVADVGAPVIAVTDGTVLAVRTDPQLGTLIEVDHGTVIGVYAQVQQVKVRAGQVVRRGDPLASVARAEGTEQALPPHLHFEVLSPSNRTPIDPSLYLGLGGSRL